MSLATAIEALLFASDQPLSTARLAEVLDEVRRDLKRWLQHRAMTIGMR